MSICTSAICAGDWANPEDESVLRITNVIHDHEQRCVVFDWEWVEHRTAVGMKREGYTLPHKTTWDYHRVTYIINEA